METESNGQPDCMIISEDTSNGKLKFIKLNKLTSKKAYLQDLTP